MPPSYAFIDGKCCAAARDFKLTHYPGDLSLTDITTADASGVAPAERAEIQSLNAAHAARLSGMRSAAVAGKNFVRAREFEREDRSSGLRIIVFDDLPIACTWLGLDVVAIRPLVAEVRAQARTPSATS